jgi:hypothetical protein
MPVKGPEAGFLDVMDDFCFSPNIGFQGYLPEGYFLSGSSI